MGANDGTKTKMLTLLRTAIREDSIDLEAIRAELELKTFERVEIAELERALAEIRDEEVSHGHNSENPGQDLSATPDHGVPIPLNRPYIGDVRDYMVVRSKFLPELEKEVRRMLRVGWQPLGGISFVAGGISPIGNTGNSFVQAMIKGR